MKYQLYSSINPYFTLPHIGLLATLHAIIQNCYRHNYVCGTEKKNPRNSQANTFWKSCSSGETWTKNNIWVNLVINIVLQDKFSSTLQEPMRIYRDKPKFKFHNCKNKAWNIHKNQQLNITFILFTLSYKSCSESSNCWKLVGIWNGNQILRQFQNFSLH